MYLYRNLADSEANNSRGAPKRGDEVGDDDGCVVSVDADADSDVDAVSHALQMRPFGRDDPP